jgi:hypothetical protein
MTPPTQPVYFKGLVMVFVVADIHRSMFTSLAPLQLFDLTGSNSILKAITGPNPLRIFLPIRPALLSPVTPMLAPPAGLSHSLLVGSL